MSGSGKKQARPVTLTLKNLPLKAHENILIFDEDEDYECGHAVVFYKGQPIYNPQKTMGHVRKTSKTGKTYSSESYGKESAKPFYDSTERYPRSVLQFKSDKQKLNLHPTQKPVALMEYLIKTYTNEGDTVLDNCMGSGTTGVACVNTNRNFIGMELDENYFKIATQRIFEAYDESVLSI